MQFGEASFPLYTIDLNNDMVLIRPEQAEEAKGKNVIIGEERPKNVNDKILAREVVLEKTPDGKESLKITLKASRPGGKQVPRKTRVGLLLKRDRSDYLFDWLDWSPPGPSQNIQAQVLGSGYFESEWIKGTRRSCEAEAHLWSVA